MPIAVEMRFPGATTDQYDKIVERMGLRPMGPGAPGGIFHSVAQTDTGLRIVDVWENQETFEKFAREQIVPYAKEVGISSDPEMEVHQVHSYLTTGPSVS